MIAPLPAFDRVSVGFPGVVRDGVVVTAPPFRGYFPARVPLARALARRWDKPDLPPPAHAHGFESRRHPRGHRAVDAAQAGSWRGPQSTMTAAIACSTTHAISAGP
jgi:hypothetical protein